MSYRSDKPDRKTHTFDATDQILGRLASRVAYLLMGKHKRDYAPNKDEGDEVIIKNAAGIRLTGRKLQQKEYKHFSGYPGGLKRIRLETMLKESPKKLLQLAISRMLPKNRLRSRMIKRLKIE